MVYQIFWLDAPAVRRRTEMPLRLAAAKSTVELVIR
jgi:hypothetical protein